MRSRSWRVLSAGMVLIGALSVAGCPNPNPNPNPGPLGGEKGALVRLTPGAINANPENQHLRKNQDNDHVRWVNETNNTETLNFLTDWPFLETKENIVIPPHSSSAWFSLDPNLATPKSYDYHVSPPLKSGGPPGEPVITGDP